MIRRYRLYGLPCAKLAVNSQVVRNCTFLATIAYTIYPSDTTTPTLHESLRRRSILNTADLFSDTLSLLTHSPSSPTGNSPRPRSDSSEPLPRLLEIPHSSWRTTSSLSIPLLTMRGSCGHISCGSYCWGRSGRRGRRGRCEAGRIEWR